MKESLSLIGFGEAGRTFALAAGWRESAAAFDIKTDDPATRQAMLDDYAEARVQASLSVAEALRNSSAILSLVTADRSLDAAGAAAPHLAAGALFLDMNSVAPETKKAAAAAIEAGGGRYVDVAIMSPVRPTRLDVPLLLSGPCAAAGADALSTIGFTNVRVVPGEVGRASAIKMIRSVMIKGIEALTAECLIAAARADVVDDVLSSLGEDWRARADYNLERMLRHGLRRSAEMEEVSRTLVGLGVHPGMTNAAVRWQRELGLIGCGIGAVPDGLSAKLESVAK
jgi:3-hydroxyisobutyrate dehydrogenase-like beta-hydroxyacid dehydrogenase